MFSHYDELGALIAGRIFTLGDRLLEDRGLINAKPQAGFYVRHRARALTGNVLLRSSFSKAVTPAAHVGSSAVVGRQ
jgi:hypothetical protein